jgi:hypothetical protein
MLAASWALVHPPWIPALRLHLRWDLISRSVSQSKALAPSSLLSTSRPRYYLDPSKNRSALLRSPYASQASAKKLVNLVEEGKYQLAEKFRVELLESGVEIQADNAYEGAVEELIRNKGQGISLDLSNWFALLPNAQNPDQDAFRGIRQLLQASPTANLHLIIQFGMTCASKGYALILREEILPLVAQHADGSAYAKFAKDAEIQAREHQSDSEMMPPEAVFEDVSEDYTIVNSGSTPPPPSILNLITNNLPKVLPQPDPDDTMVFEDESDYDYVSYASTSPPTSLPEILTQLVIDGLYDQAYRLLEEIRDVGDVPIHHSAVYEHAAEATLDPASTLTPEERLMRFTTWLSLIPPVHLVQPPRQFLKIRQLIFRAPYPDYRLAIRFATILASKGYGELIIPHAVPLIVRFAPGNISRQFIRDFEKADEEYWTMFNPEEATIMTKKTTNTLRGKAAVYLAYSSRFETAFSLLPKPGDSFRLTSAIYDILLRSLRHAEYSAAAKFIPLVEDLRKQEIKQAEDTEVLVFRDNFGDLSPTNYGTDVGRAILYLRKALTSKHNLPHPLILSNFFERYVSSTTKRKRRAITTLRNKALQSGGRSADTYLFAEMHYYRRIEQDDLVIKTFADHFHLIGVPQDDVMMHYQRISQHLKEKYQNEEPSTSSQLHKYELRQAEKHSQVNNPTGRFPRDTPSFKVARRKYWPSHLHTTLVWHSLLNLTSSDAAVDHLYKKLVRIATEHFDPSQVTPDDNPVLPPPSSTHNVSASAFTPFIRRLMLGFGSNRGAMVLSDMLKAGLEPTLHHFTELAGQYARLGDAPKALMILDRMEAAKNASMNAGVEQASPATAFASRDKPVGLSFPAPDVVLYTSLLRGFLISRNLRAIDEVDRRLKKYHQYTPGETPLLDEIYAEIRLLREEYSSSVSPIFIVSGR